MVSGIETPIESHVFFGRHATRDASKQVFLTSKAAPVLGQTLIDHLASDHGGYDAATCFGSFVSVPRIHFFLNHS